MVWSQRITIRFSSSLSSILNSSHRRRWSASHFFNAFLYLLISFTFLILKEKKISWDERTGTDRRSHTDLTNQIDIVKRGRVFRQKRNLAHLRLVDTENAFWWLNAYVLCKRGEIKIGRSGFLCQSVYFDIFSVRNMPVEHELILGWIVFDKDNFAFAWQ